MSSILGNRIAFLSLKAKNTFIAESPSNYTIHVIRIETFRTIQ